MTVEDNLVLGAYRRKRTGEKNYLDQLDHIFALFPRLKERRKQATGTLSGGERQMLAVGRALMGKPQLLMLDESSLGPCTADRKGDLSYPSVRSEKRVSQLC